MENNKQRFNKLFDLMSREFVAPAELKRVGDLIVKAFQDFKKEVSENVASLKAKIEAYEKNHTKLVSDIEKRVLQKADQTATTSLNTVRQRLEASVKAVEEMIPELPDYDTQLFAFSTRLDEVASSMPAQADLTPIQEQIDVLEKDIEELKKRPMGTGGGVSDMRIRQAFKYILHTEAPVGDIDGVNTSYTVANVPFAVIGLVLNGEHIAELPNYTVAGRTITFASPIPAAYSGKDFEIKYIG